MNTTPEHDQKIAKLTLASVWPHYITKIEKKGRTLSELYEVTNWLTGFSKEEIDNYIATKVTFEVFFKEAKINTKANLITGVICGYRIEEISTPLTQQIRYLDKLVDELAKGKKMEKILRK
ncbi:conserved hypothetical protein [Flavobacterium sp. 9AF]|uniref:DUF2200 domain-containing protein n=1 Tax=Flavobacterium sp. 9AF TaxID=2653142 RepID=UPI0012F20C64|nr:DUF2200 domain-containing protein [Flavobacterium sp. 9AF]VXB64758.1 conserved hypothetical protein [Flavobacterium sp. 9AF]